jgi:hypothetical protein
VVKTLAVIVMANLVLLLELAGVVLVCVGLGLWLGGPAVCVAVGVAALVKSVELDVGRSKS